MFPVIVRSRSLFDMNVPLDMNNPVTTSNNILTSCNVISCNLILSSLHWIILIWFNIWINNCIREYTSTYEVLFDLFFMAFLSLVLSESLFFITIFYSSLYTYSCSYSIYSTLEGLYLSDPNSLTFTNTILLSNSGLSLGCSYLYREVHVLRHSLCLLILSLSLASIFILVTIKEFHNITLHMNDSIASCVFYFLIGLHLLHVIVGILYIIALILWTTSYSRSILNFNYIPIQVRVISHPSLYYTLQLVYWHFVECLWLFIYYILYH